MKTQSDALGGASSSAINPVINGDLFIYVFLEEHRNMIYLYGKYKYNTRSETLEIRRDFSMYNQMSRCKDKERLLDYLDDDELLIIHRFFNN